ncbi:MAG: FapA family protein [Proteobacteria bacterium]|nr:FapA family protein [Pseudomonadota bacterium]
MTNGRGNHINCPLIGLLAVKNQLITKEELEAGLIQCTDSVALEKDLIAYLLAQELVSAKNMERLARAAKTLEIRQKEYKFGAIAISKGFINKSVLDLALEEQEEDIRGKRKPRLVGDMLVDAGLLTGKQRDYILKLQNRVRLPLKKAAPATQPPAGEAPENKMTENQMPGKESSGAEPPAAEDAGELLEPEIIAGGIKLQVSKDFMAAFLTKTDHFNQDMLVMEVKEALFEKNIVSGIVVDEMIDGFIRSSGFKTQSFRVAKGVRPIQGQNAKLEFFFNTDYLKAGGLDGKGNIDFKERGEIPHVEEGTVLAEKTPMLDSRWGQTIFGDEVETIPGEDIPLRFGKGAKLSEDGLKVLAAVKGFPKYSLSGVIFVHEEYITGGDVDYETGHIDYNGNVNIKGCIKPGFKVRGNDVKCVELDGGIVEADGDLVVLGGINEGKIYARGNVFAKFIHKSEIVCMGNINVGKEIVDTRIESSGSCVIENGKLISSQIVAKMGVSAQHIGTEMATPCTIKVGHDGFTQKELEKNKANTRNLKENLQVLQAKRDKLKEENMELQKQITKLAHVQDRSQLEQAELEAKMADPENQKILEELKQRLEQSKSNARNAEKNLDRCFEKSEIIEEAVEKIDQEIGFLTQKCDDLAQEKNNILQWAKENPGNAIVMALGSIQPGTVIVGKHSEMTVDTLIRRSRVMEVLFRKEGAEGRQVYELQIKNC